LESPSILTRQRTALRGDFNKLHKATGWKPTVGFKKMILDLLETAQNG
jgi:nucleoside-diphosphate-sugar epimerase